MFAGWLLVSAFTLTYALDPDEIPLATEEKNVRAGLRLVLRSDVNFGKG